MQEHREGPPPYHIDVNLIAKFIGNMSHMLHGNGTTDHIVVNRLAFLAENNRQWERMFRDAALWRNQRDWVPSILDDPFEAATALAHEYSPVKQWRMHSAFVDAIYSGSKISDRIDMMQTSQMRALQFPKSFAPAKVFFAPRKFFALSSSSI